MWLIGIFDLRKLSLLCGLGLALALPALQVSVAASDPTVPGETPGQKLLAKYCLVCHAGGDVEFYPRMEAVAARLNADQLAAAILNGKFDRAGEFDGQTVPVMPAHARLANESIAEIVNYLKGFEVGHPSHLSVERVARLRGMDATNVAPPLAPADQARASKIYHNQCAGCHAVDRSGRAGSALYTWAMQQRGTAGLMATLHLGSSWACRPGETSVCGRPIWNCSRDICNNR